MSIFFIIQQEIQSNNCFLQMIAKIYQWCCPIIQRDQRDIQDPLLIQNMKKSEMEEFNDEGTRYNQSQIGPQRLDEKVSSNCNEESKNNEMVIFQGIPPNFNTTSKAPSFEKKNQEPSNNSQFLEKSYLWDIENSCDLIYLNPAKHCLCSFYFCKKQPQKKPGMDLLAYFLKKSKQKYNAIISKELFLSVQNIEYWVNHVWIQLGVECQVNNPKIEVLRAQRLGKGLRLHIFDQIVVAAAKMKTYQQVHSFCMEVIQTLSAEERKNIVYLFPRFLTLGQISNILFKGMEKIVEGQPMDKAIIHLTFEMELIQLSTMDCGITVKSRSPEKKKSNQYYDQQKITMPIHPLNNNEKTKNFHKNFCTFLRTKTVKQYLNVRIKKQTNFMEFTEQIKQYFPENLEQKMEQIEERSEKEGFFYIIPQKTKQFIKKYDWRREQQSKCRVDTDTPVKKQWDDNFKEAQASLTRKNQKAEDLENISPDELDGVQLDDEDFDLIGDKIQEQFIDEREQIMFSTEENS